MAPGSLISWQLYVHASPCPCELFIFMLTSCSQLLPVTLMALLPPQHSLPCDAQHQPALAPTPQPHHSPLQTHFPAQYLGVTPRTPSPPGQLCVPTAGYLPWQDFPSPFLRCLAETDPYLGLCCPSLWDIHGCCTTFAHDGE